MRHHGPNWPIALASLVVSVMLWFVVYAQSVPAPQNVRAPIAIDGLDRSRFFVRDLPNDLRLVVNAPADRAKDLADERITASVDLSSPRTGTHVYPVTVSPDWVRRYIDARPTAQVSIEPVESRTLRITRKVKGLLPDASLQLTSTTLSPEKAEITGPASEVESVAEVRAFFDLSAISATDGKPQESKLIVLDSRGVRPQDVQTTPMYAQYTYQIEVAETTKPAIVVADVDDVTYDSSVVGNGYRIDPPSVDVKGHPDVLARVSQIHAIPVHAHGISRDRTFRVRLVPPKGTQIVGPKEVSVTILVLPIPKPERRSADTPSATGTQPPGSATSATPDR